MQRKGSMVKLIAAAIAAVSMAALLPSTAQADPVQVGAALCGGQGGQATVPAGSEVVVRQVISFRFRGTGVDYLDSAQMTQVSVNGGAPVDVSRDFAPLARTPVTTDLGVVVWVWRSQVLYPTGITLGAGQQLTFRFVQTLSRGVPDWVFSDTGAWSFQFDGPGVFEDVTCTVTGV